MKHKECGTFLNVSVSSSSSSASSFTVIHPVFLCNAAHNRGTILEQNSLTTKTCCILILLLLTHLQNNNTLFHTCAVTIIILECTAHSYDIPLLCPGHAGTVGPSPSNVQHQQIRAETESSGCPWHPQVLRLHQWETEIPQLFCLRSVYSHLAEEQKTTAQTHFSGFALSDKDSQSVSRSVHQ